MPASLDSHKLADAVEKMAREVGHLTSGLHQMHVLTQTKSDKAREQQEMLDEWKKRRAEGPPPGDENRLEQEAE